MQTQANSKEFERFYFEIPIGKRDAINAVKGLLKGLNIENKFFHTNSTKEDKSENIQTKLNEFKSFSGIIDMELSDENIKEIRAKRYAK